MIFYIFVKYQYGDLLNHFSWDFKEYSVSNFAHTVLSRFSIDPLFVIEELNPALIQKVPKLKKALELRRQATEMAKYLASCRIAGDTMKEEDYKDCIMEVTLLMYFLFRIS